MSLPSRFAFVSIMMALLAGGCSTVVQAQWFVDLETGLAANGYNDVRIPGTTGTDLSLTDDLDSDPGIYWRARIERRFGQRHRLSLLFAPLRLEAKGIVRRSIVFTDVTFPADTEMRSAYRFDSYRLTYTYDLHKRESLRLGVGLTAKIRDAAIKLSSENQAAEKSNTGFVPLLHFALDWDVSSRLRLVLDADALAAPQGRAEDILLALSGRIHDSLRLRAGYRMLEGGADNDEVYSFTLVHYLLVGIEVEL